MNRQGRTRDKSTCRATLFNERHGNPAREIAERLESDIMATIALDGNDLVVRLSTLEKIGALRGDIRLPLASVRVVRVSPTFPTGAPILEFCRRKLNLFKER